MEEWTQNLMKSETRLFLERTEPPEEDADQMFTMQASGIMFQMIDFAIDSGQRAVSESSPRVLREFSETPSRILRDFSETSLTHLRDFSETSLTHLRDFSETSPENPTLGFPRWVTKPSIGFPRLVTSRVTFPSVGGEPIAISSVACNRSFVCSVQLATELPLIGCWWPRLSRLTTNRSFELVGWVPNQFQLACSAAELESDGTTLGDRPTEVGSDADCIGSAHASLDRLGTSQINWDAPNRCLYAGSET
ncbi:hypothetical protein KEM48_007801 [Puccinia striiformis f. sp. tritici PST-130]|nr:hypothetical protein Pst134EB_011022 [Puccinia striiformis f. sp. tritici]KAI9621262.1 hypothetical protein KEM48_007801 [Puccinia striiformis f. sp. tritici PST-130]